MKRKEIKALSINHANDASQINNKRGMARKTKRKSSKKLRSVLKLTDGQVQKLVSNFDAKSWNDESL